MEIISELVSNNSWAIPLAVTLVAGLLFIYCVKRTAQPPFDKLSAAVSDDRKQANNKKRKTKDKKSSSTANGHVVSDKNTPVKAQKKSPAKEAAEVAKQQPKKQETNKQVKKNNELAAKKDNVNQKSIEEIKNKKNKNAVINEKPLDYDDGNWETVPTKADKKKKTDSPTKKDKKEKKKLENDKLVKEVVNKELREKNKQKDNKDLEATVEEIKEKLAESVLIQDAPVSAVIEEKKDKKKVEKKPLKNDSSTEKKLIDEPIIKQIAEAMKETAPASPTSKSKPEGGVAFDELGDVWTEAKVTKKSKKKARRDN